MKGIWLAFALLMAAACSKEGGKSRSHCAAVAIKLLPFLAEGGPQVEVDAVNKLVQRCETCAAGNTDDKMFRCAAAAASDEAVGACVRDAMSVFTSLAPGAKDVSSSTDAALSEAELTLARIKTNAKAEFNINASYPAVVAPLTPAVPCCDQVGKRCKPDPADWDTSPWKALDVPPFDEPFQFQYSYVGEASGIAYEAVAIGDPGCKGKPIKLVLRGTVLYGNPKATLSRE